MGGIIVITILIYLLNAGVFKYSSESTPKITKDKKLQVFTSFYPLYFFASQIGGDKAEVRNITPSGSEPHDYDPSTRDIARIESSNMLILNGNVEAWANKIKDNLREKNVTIITAGEGLFSQQVTKEKKTTTDPHIWLDPILAKKEAAKISAGYIKIDPINTSYYKDNEKKLSEKLDQLDALFNQGLTNCKDRNIITSHAAFGYLASRYGLTQIPISGLSPDAEPSSQQLAEIARFAKNNNIKFIFFESLVSPKLSETVAREIGAKTMVLDPIEGISNDDIKQGKNYITVMQNNLKNLQTALQCNM